MGNSTFWGPDWDSLAKQDPEISSLLLKELERARGGLQLIASENFTSPAVLAALGSTFSNKYAEGYPGKRYYGGCSVVDEAEVIGIERAKKLFDADHANLQPHSGASANIAVYGAFTKPGDTVLAMSLAQGGHLTHGSPVSFSGKWFNPIGYSVDPKTELIDYDNVRDLAKQHKPKMIVAGATAYPRLVDFKLMREIADEVGAILWVDAAHFIGLVAGKAIPSPVPYADVVSFTTHKVLLNGCLHRFIPTVIGKGVVLISTQRLALFGKGIQTSFPAFSVPTILGHLIRRVFNFATLSNALNGKWSKYRIEIAPLRSISRDWARLINSGILIPSKLVWPEMSLRKFWRLGFGS